MCRTVRVGKGLFKKTLSYAISNAKYGDTIIIEDIDMSREKKQNFVIPKDALIIIENASNNKTIFRDYRFEVYGYLAILNVIFEPSKDKEIFLVDNGTLNITGVKFEKTPQHSNVFPVSVRNSGIFEVVDSSISSLRCENSVIKLSGSNVYGSSFSESSKWEIKDSYLDNRILRDQFTVRNSEIMMENSEFKVFSDILTNNYPILSFTNSKLKMENSKITPDNNFDLKKNLLVQALKNTSLTLENCEISTLGLSESKIHATNFETVFLRVTRKSNMKASSLILNKKMFENAYSISMETSSQGEIQLLKSQILSTNIGLNNSKLKISFDGNMDNISFYKDSNSEIQSESKINIISTDKKKDEKQEKQVAKHVNNSEPANEKENTNALDELKNLVGLKNAKRQAIEFITTHKVNKFKKQKGLGVEGATLHSVYKGNPGTGKTTVARLIAKILAQENVIKKDLLVEVSRQDLVASYVGQTAPKTENVLKSALGGVLFIDEAYTLYSKSENDYGIEAIEAILKFMEDNRDNIMIIFAGYTKEMDDLISMNPGLESRIQNEIVFEDYTISEMMQIGEKMLSEYTFNKEVYELKLREKFEQQKVNGNARFIRNLNDKILRNQANRIFEDNVMNEEYNLIRDVDIEKI